MDDEQIRARLHHAAPNPGAAPTSAIVQRGRRRRAVVGVTTAAVFVLAAVSVVGVLTSRSADMPVIDDPPTEATPTPTASVEPTPTPATTAPNPTHAPSSDAASPDPTTASPSPEPTPDQVVLQGDGLGVATVGDSPGEAVAALTDALAEPREDTGWTAMTENQSWLGVCGSDHWRGVAWGQLSVIFTSPDPQGGPEAVLTSWAYGSSRVPPDEEPLTTEAGLGVGDTRDRAVELYGDQATYHEGNEVFPPWLRIETDGSEYVVQAILSREDHQTIRRFEGGYPCGE